MATDPSPDGKSSLSDSAMDGLSLRQRIVKVVEASEIELTPLQIAQKLNVNHSTVRVYLPQLVAQNKLITPYKGAYCSQITYTVKFQGVRVHNIVAVGKADIDLHFEKTEIIGTVKVRVVFGIERQKVSIFVSCDAGMDRNSCLLALDRAFHIVKDKLGRELEDIELKTFELNRDYLGVRVDRATCITRTGLYGVVERVYQKEQGVRHEWKVSQNTSLKDFEALLQGGVTGFNVMQANFALVQEVKKLVEAQKMTNDELRQQGKLLEALAKWIWKKNDSDKKS